MKSINVQWIPCKKKMPSPAKNDAHSIRVYFYVDRSASLNNEYSYDVGCYWYADEIWSGGNMNWSKDQVHYWMKFPEKQKSKRKYEKSA